jgi:hypothetical protein
MTLEEARAALLVVNAKLISVSPTSNGRLEIEGVETEVGAKDNEDLVRLTLAFVKQFPQGMPGDGSNTF